MDYEDIYNFNSDIMGVAVDVELPSVGTFVSLDINVSFEMVRVTSAFSCNFEVFCSYVHSNTKLNEALKLIYDEDKYAISYPNLNVISSKQYCESYFYDAEE